MDQRETLELFRECESAKRRAQNKGKKDDAHDAAKERWNEWANELLEEKKLLESKGLWKAARENGHKQVSVELTPEAEDWLERSKVDFSNVFFGTKNQEAQTNNKRRELGAMNKEVIYSLFDTIDFSSFIFPSEVIFDNAYFFVPTLFIGSTFSLEAHFYQTKFQETVSFYKSKFLASSEFSEVESLQNISFRSAHFKGMSVFNNARFAKSVEFNDANFIQDVEFINAIFEGRSDFSNNTFLGNIKFDDAKFKDNASFHNTRFEKIASFREVDFSSSVDFCSSRFMGNVFFLKAKFNNPQFDSAEFNSVAIFEGTTFEGGAWFSHSKFRQKVNFKGISLNRGNLSGMLFYDQVIFDEADLSSLDLSNLVMDGASFKGTNLSKSNLQLSSILNVQFDMYTKLSDANVYKCKVDRYSLEYLDAYGGLTDGAIMDMDIHDDIETLRLNYGGYLQWIHIFAMICFIFPYAWFIICRWVEAEFLNGSEAENISLGSAIVRFFVSGGVHWKEGFILHWTFVSSISALMYNALRFVLFFKTKHLELKQSSRKWLLPFSLDETAFWMINFRCTLINIWKQIINTQSDNEIIDYYKVSWRGLLNASNALFYLYLFLVLVNSMHFLTKQIPINP